MRMRVNIKKRLRWWTNSEGEQGNRKNSLASFGEDLEWTERPLVRRVTCCWRQTLVSSSHEESSSIMATAKLVIFMVGIWKWKGSNGKFYETGKEKKTPNKKWEAAHQENWKRQQSAVANPILVKRQLNLIIINSYSTNITSWDNEWQVVEAAKKRTSLEKKFSFWQKMSKQEELHTQLATHHNYSSPGYENGLCLIHNSLSATHPLIRSYRVINANLSTLVERINNENLFPLSSAFHCSDSCVHAFLFMRRPRSKASCFLVLFPFKK